MPIPILALVTQSEKQLKLRQRLLAGQIDQLYLDVIAAITPMASRQLLPDGIFTFDSLPVIDKLIDKLLNRLATRVTELLINGIDGAWTLSNVKNNLIADARLDKSLIPKNKRITFYDPNTDALEAFKKQTVDGLDLSASVYKSVEVYKSELELGLADGISRGLSAAEMGRELRDYLKYPDKLFRRVRDDKGNLQLSKNAKAFHPGQGVYRSSRANIERLTRTSTNMAYRNADIERYRKTPFILGYQIKTSLSHPKYDICDELAGDYPVTFTWAGWHPQCLCFIVPILMNDEQFNQYQRLVLRGDDSAENVAKIAPKVIDMPTQFTEYVNNNVERISGWKKAPLWWQNNPEFVPELVK